LAQIVFSHDNWDDLHEVIMTLLEPTSAVYVKWRHLYRQNRPWAKSGIHPLYIAAETGLERACHHLLQKGSDVNAPGGYYGTPLQATSSRGHTTTVWLLLEKGADVNAQGGEYGSALQAAASLGHDTTVRLLLEKGADVNSQGGEYRNVLQEVALWGHDTIVWLLIEKGADVNVKGGVYGNALQAAASGGYDTTVRLLIEKGADVNAQGGKYGGTLQAAVVNGRDVIASLLEVTAAAVPNETPRAALPEFKLVHRRPFTTHLSTSPCTHCPCILSQGSGWIVTFSKHVDQCRVDVTLMHTVTNAHSIWR
jgi:ankyrin repeat protein